MPVNSHIQVPISIIKNFSFKKTVNNNGHINKDNFVYSLNLLSSEIIEKTCDEYGSQFGYYTDDVEKLLSDNYETPFGNFKKKCYEFIKGKTSSITITKEDFLLIKKYLKSCFYRLKVRCDEYNKFSLLKDLGPFSPSFYVKACSKLDIQPIEDFNNYSVTILISKSNRKFINNFAGFAFLPVGGEEQIFMPICPSGGLLFFKPKNKEDIYRDLQTSDENTTFEINKRIYQTEMNCGGNSLFSKTKNELREILNFSKNHRNN